MRVLHLSDLHFGKIVYGYYMDENLEYALSQVLDLLDREKVDCLIIAGDIYDRKLVGKESVEIYNSFLEDLVIKRGLPVLAISGNHDPRERLEAGNRLLEKSGYYVEGMLKEEIRKVSLRDRDGEVDFYLVPFFDVSEAETVYGQDFEDFQACYSHIIDGLDLDPKRRSCIICHAYVTKSSDERPEKQDGEKPLTIGGKEYVTSDLFKDFTYTALGHIHRKTRVGERIYYPGSLNKFSFSEAGQEKTCSIVDISGQGEIEIETFPLKQKKDFRLIRGTFDHIIREAKGDDRREDYILFELEDRDLISDAMLRLKDFYPNACAISYPYQKRAIEEEEVDFSPNKSSLDLLKDFYHFKTGEGLPLDLEKRSRKYLGENHETT